MQLYLQAMMAELVQALTEHGVPVSPILLEECLENNVAAILQLLEGDIGEPKGSSGMRPTVGDEVLIVGGKGKGSLATITCDCPTMYANPTSPSPESIGRVPPATATTTSTISKQRPMIFSRSPNRV